MHSPYHPEISCLGIYLGIITRSMDKDGQSSTVLKTKSQKQFNCASREQMNIGKVI